METEAPDVYALASRADNGGPAVAEIGWREPFILARSDGDTRWQVIDTRTKSRQWISDQARTESADLRQIQIYPAPEAWKQLHWRGRPKW